MKTAIVLLLGSSLAAAAEPPRPTATAVVQTLKQPFRNYLLVGVERSDGSMRVAVLTKQGAPVFESAYTTGEPRTLEWTYEGERKYSMTAYVGERRPRLDQMVTAARDIVTMISKGLTPQYRGPVKFDTWGCDAGPDSCGVNGNCCDTHDECYALNNCSASSWSGITSLACMDCNTCAESCVSGGANSGCSYGYRNTGQPSVCCALGNCGRERCTGTDTWNDPYCDPTVGSYPGGGDWGEGFDNDLQQDYGWGWASGGGGGWGFGIPGGSIGYCTYMVCWMIDAWTMKCVCR